MTSIAIDIGASGGKILSFDFIEDKIISKEIYRFDNKIDNVNGNLVWNIENLYNDIIKGLKLVKKSGIKKCTVGICTWGVDYILLDENYEIMDNVYSYRDSRTDEAIDKVTKIISKKEIYNKTGIQFLKFNTLYQLFMHDKKIKSKAKKIMLIPDWIYYKLTGKFINEITNMSTSQLLNIKTLDFDDDLLKIAGVNRNQFSDLTWPGKIINSVSSEVKGTEFPEMKFIVVGTHDTASAVAGLNLKEDSAFLSMGTWGLIGCELQNIKENHILNNQSFTNEYGVYNTNRYLKNITGMWFLQEIKTNLSNILNYSDMTNEASKISEMKSLINCNDEMFNSPENMYYQVIKYLDLTQQKLPGTVGEVIRCVIDSLAIIIGDHLKKLEEDTGKTFNEIVIAGGGSRNKLFCQILSNVTKKDVIAGIEETTSLGNIIVQKIAIEEFKDLVDARFKISKSFNNTTYKPNDTNYTNSFSKLDLLKSLQKN